MNSDRNNDWNDRNDMDLWSIVDLLIFLRQTFAVWKKHQLNGKELETNRHKISTKRTPSIASEDPEAAGAVALKSPRQFLLQLVDTLLAPLSNISTSSFHKQDHCMTVNASASARINFDTQLFDLILTIASLSGELVERNDEPLHLQILEKVFAAPPLSGDLLYANGNSWLSLAFSLKTYLRCQDFSVVGDVLTAAVAGIRTRNEDDATTPTKADHLAQLGSYIVLFAFPCGDDSTNFPWNGVRQLDHRKWTSLLLDFLKAASYDHSIYEQAEATLLDCFVAQSSMYLQQWCDALDNAAVDEPWVLANAYLLLDEARSEVRITLLSFPVMDGNLQSHGGYAGWRALVDLCCQKLMGGRAMYGYSSRDFNNQIELAQQLLSDVLYVGQGNFSMRNGDPCDLANTNFIYKSLSLGAATLQHKFLSFQRKHARRWLGMVSTAVLLRDPVASLEAPPSDKLDFLFSVFVVVTIFFEIPDLRVTIAELFLKGFVESSHMCCLMLQVIVRTTIERTNDVGMTTPEQILEVLEPLACLLHQPMPEPVFDELLSALRVLPSVRSTILKAARKLLQSLHLRLGTPSGDDQQHRLPFSQLLSLILPTANEPLWDQYGLEAWRLFSDAIALDRPRIPPPTQVWVHETIERKISEKQLPVWVARHFLRAFLFRFLSNFESEKGALVFRPLPSGRCRHATLAESLDPCQLRDDVMGLAHVVLSLADICCDASVNGEKAPPRGYRTHLAAKLEIRLSDEKPSSSVLRNEKPNLQRITDECFAAMYRYILAQRIYGPLVAASNGNSSATNFMGECRSFLISQEISSLEGSVEMDDLPLWLSESGVRRARGVESHLSPRMDFLSSLCELFIEVMLDAEPSSKSSFSTAFESHYPCSALASLFQTKRMLCGETGPMFSDRLVSRLAATFSKLAPRTIHEFIDCAQLGQLSFDEVGSLAHALLGACAFLSRKGGTPESKEPLSKCNPREAIFGLLNVYHGCASETTSIAMAAYLDDQGRRMRTDRQCKEGSHLRFENEDEVSLTLQKLRLAVVEAVKHSIETCARRYLHHFPDSLCSLRSKDDAAKQISPGALFVAGVKEISCDLRSGLECFSRCLPSELYLGLLHVLDTLCGATAKCLKMGLALDHDKSVSNICGARQNLIEIVVMFPSDSAPQLGQSLHTICHSLQSLRRLIMRWCWSSGFEEPDYFDPSCDILSQCTSILPRWRKSRYNAASWDQIAGTNHVMQSCGVRKSDRTMPHLATHENQAARFPVEESTKIQSDLCDSIKLRTEETWFCALCTTLNSIENNWDESLNMVESAGEYNNSSLAYFKESRETLLTVSSWRQKDLGQTFTVLHQLLLASMDDDGEVITMPKAATEATFSLLSTISKVLIGAVGVVQTYLRCGNSRTHVLCEAIAVLITWLLDHKELSLTSREWSVREHNFMSGECISEGDLSRTSDRHMSSNLIRQWDDLEQRIRVMHGCLRKSSGIMSSSIKTVDAVVCHVSKSSESKWSETGHEGCLEKLLKNKIRKLMKSRKRCHDKTRMGNTAADKAHLNEQGTHGSCKEAKRSRNSVINEWLRSDRHSDHDTFDDLNDFLVDG